VQVQVVKEVMVAVVPLFLHLGAVAAAVQVL
jgi:hypothetical protein